MRAWWLAVVVVALLGAMVVPASADGAGAGATPSASSGSNKASFGIGPASATGLSGAGGFFYASTPGGVFSDRVAVLNYSVRPLVLRLEAVDAVNTTEGGFTGVVNPAQNVGAGAWVHLPASKQEVEVPARTLKAPGVTIVPFTVFVPQNAEPGDHAALVLAVLTTRSTRGNVPVILQQRIGTRLFIRVTGPLHPKLTVSVVSTSYHMTWNPFATDRVTVTYIIRNVGNVKLGGTVTAEIRGLFGSVARAPRQPLVQVLLPGNQVTHTLTIDGVYPEFWDTATVTVRPLNAVGDANPPGSIASGSRSFWAIPWPVIVIVVLLAAAVFGVLWRRRRQATAGEPPQQSPNGNGSDGPEGGGPSDGAEVVGTLQ